MAACGVLVTTVGIGLSTSAQATGNTGAVSTTAADSASTVSASSYSGGIMMTADPNGGYWTVNGAGAVTSFGGAPVYGSPATSGLHLSKPIVGIAPTSDGQGYWLVASDGGVFSFGDAAFYGSTGSLRLNAPIVGIAVTPDGGGYWLVASDGGVFSFGDAQFYGSAGGLHLSKPIVGMAATPDGQGYWLVASDGGIFTYGDAAFYGSTGSLRLNAPIVGIAPTSDGEGYWLVAIDGGVFSFGDAQFYGSGGDSSVWVTGIIINPSTPGYTLVQANGTATVISASANVLHGVKPGSTTTTTDPAPTTTKTKTTTPPRSTTTTTTTTTTTPPRSATTTLTTPAATTTTAPSSTPYPIGTVSSSEPSGMAPPGANSLAGYSQSYVTDFSGTSMPAGWNTYDGVPGGDPGAQFSPAHVVVSGGLLQLNAYQDPAYNNEWVTGGVSDSGHSQTYGAYFVRSRMTGAGPTGVELLWPANNSWPPEIDFNETKGITTSTTSTVWYGAENMDVRTLNIDMTQWHTWGVIWTPTSITYTVDGQVWATVTASSEIPNIPMTLDLQEQTWCSSGFACPSTPQSMDVDWVAEYSPS
jgi:beta-glucanase (GH16 family)